MIQYKIQIDQNNNPCAVTIAGKITTIPFNPDNADYQAYLLWLSEGNTPEPADDK